MAGDSLDLTGALSKLMSDPSLLATIASAIGGGSVGDASAAVQKKEDGDIREEPQADSSAALGNILPAMSKLSSLGSLAAPPKSSPNDSRACLLNALKPYMSPKRRDAIDKLVKFSNLSELLKKI